MEVDATIQDDFVDDDVEYISAMKLAVSDDDDGENADSGGSRMDTTTKTAVNRENGGVSEAAGSSSSGSNNKRKLLYDQHHWTVSEGEKLYGFDEETGKPTYSVIEVSATNSVAEMKNSGNGNGNGVVAKKIECSIAPPKKSRPSIEEADNTSEVSSTNSPSTSSQLVVVPIVSPAIPTVSTVSTVPAATTSQSSNTHKAKSIKDEFYKKPFDFGWKREVVYRANPEISKDKADVYYIAPSGKKMRSKNEIIPFLDNELTIEHFCFAKEPMGLSSNLEIVRSAKQTHRTSAETINSSTNTSSGKRVSKPKAPKGASPPPQGWTPTRALKNSSSLNTNSNSPGSGNAATTASPKATPKSSKSRKVGDPPPCTMQCVAAMGTIPQLQCIKCLCLFHHECVGLDRKDNQYRLVSALDGGRKDYVCQSCIPPVDNSGLKENQITPKEPEKQILMNALTQGIAATAVSSTTSSLIPTTTPTNIDTLISTASPVITTAAVATVPKPLTVNTDPAVGDLPQSIAVIKGKKYVVVKKPLTQRTTNTVSAAGHATENNTTVVEATAENDIITNDRSKRHNSSSNSHRKHTSTATSTVTAVPTSTTTGTQISSFGNSAVQTTRLADSSSASLSFASNFFANVSVGYDAILHILKYLKIHERPRAASVCKIWNLVAKDRSLWQTVRMKNSKVSNWAGFTAALRRGETKHLDLRKLLVSSTKLEETWSDFCKYIGTVASLEKIDMCRCSAQVVETLFVTNPNLTILSALAINDDSLNLANLDNLVLLQELRLRTLEKCTLESDLSPLRSLKNLKHLTLSSIRQLGTKAIEVIGELNNLVSLELGECNDFDAQFTDNVLLKLSNLERLRLEIGQEQCHTLDILDSVAKLEKLSQLEFINFDIKPGFDAKLANCTNIRKLLIIPTYISQSATTNNIVLNAVLTIKDTLQVFTWGVTVELLRVTALYVDQCEDSTRKERRHFDECIPVLKPVPGSVVLESIDEEPSSGANSVPQIEILPLDKVESILKDNLGTTKFTIVKVPYHATWKQQLVE